MSYPPLDLSVTPAYRPAPYLISGPGAFLTAEELMRYFEDFYASLGCINTAPHMVFERLIGNLGVPVHVAIEKARQNSANESSGVGITCPRETAREEASSTKQHVIRSCTVPDNFPATQYNKSFSTTGEVCLSRTPIALTSILLTTSDSLIAFASVTAPKVTEFNVRLSNNCLSGLENRLKSPSCSWLELNKQDIDMQCGVWNVPARRLWDHPHFRATDHETHKITFPFPYAEPPQVLVWLKRIHLWSSVYRLLRLVVSDITRLGFTLKACSTSSSNISGLVVSWLACSVGRPGVAMGTFEVKEQKNAWPRCEGDAPFQSGWFKTPPRVVVGITGFEIDAYIGSGLSVHAVEVTSEGMKWDIDGGQDEDRLLAASGSFIAIE